jgi:hypothetical protein
MKFLIEAYYLYFAGRYDASASGVPEKLKKDPENTARISEPNVNPVR